MASATPCRYCRHFRSIDLSSRIATCAPAGCMLHARDGCSKFEREPGVDDNDWKPPEGPVEAWKPIAAPAPRNRGRDGWWTEPRRPRRPAPQPPVVPILVRPRDPFGGLFNWNDDG
jgi:hypothetical protein